MEKFLASFPNVGRSIIAALAMLVAWQFQTAVANNTEAMRDVKVFMEKTLVKMENHEVRICHVEEELKK